mgnify:CR=1 FL=1|tara:strand:+ start:455 stop:712 length:258 start_codon:yes stop_codon:yes gene_type:complete
MDAMFTNWMRRIYSSKRLTDTGLPENEWQAVVPFSVSFILGFPNGSKWLDQWESSEPEINKAILLERQRVEPWSCRARLAAFDAE